MRRLFWLALGATLAVLISRKLSRAVAKLTPQNLASSIGQGVSELAVAIGEFRADVRMAMAERELELREAAGLDDAAADGGQPG
jgi:hypothetical protein